LRPYAQEWPELAQQIGMKASRDPEEVGAAAYDFLMYSGYVCLAYFWLQMAQPARAYEAGQSMDARLLVAKRKTATFYVERMLPRAQVHKTVMLAGEAALSSLNDDEWTL